MKINILRTGNRAPYRAKQSKCTQERKKQIKQEVNRLKSHLGGLAKMAECFDVPYETAHSWCNRGVLPQYVANAVHEVAELREAGFTRSGLNPDATE